MRSSIALSRIVVAAIGFASPAPAGADEPLANLSVHGFLSQAYGRADGKSATALGITKDGTTDYRTAAIQFSYTATEKGRLVFQLSHERIGVDARASYLPDVGLDWAFYHHRFTDRTEVKVGRVPIPLGIYNEIRDVGTILPFYRPPNSFYAETNFVSETLDGVIAVQRFKIGRWGLDVEPFGGGWNTLAVSGATGLTPARANNAVGVTSWLTTPVSGLRVGGTFFRTTLRRDLTVAGQAATPKPAPENRRLWSASADGSFTRISAKAEYFQTKDGDSRDRTYYGLVSLKATRKLSLSFQYSKYWVSWFAGPRKGTISAGQRDLGAGVNYAFHPNLVVKLEGHDGEAFAAVGAPPVNRYFLASLAASF